MKHALFLNVVVMVSLCGCAANRVRIPEEGLVAKPLHYGEITRLFEKEAHVPHVFDLGFQRNSTGSKLFIGFSFWLNKERAYRTAIVTSEGITIVQGFSIVWYDDQAKPIVRLEGSTGRYDDEGRLFWQNDDAHYIFKDGPAIPYRSISGLRRVSGGDYMMFNFEGENAWVVSTLANPRQALFKLPADLNHP